MIRIGFDLTKYGDLSLHLQHMSLCTFSHTQAHISLHLEKAGLSKLNKNVPIKFNINAGCLMKMHLGTIRSCTTPLFHTVYTDLSSLTYLENAKWNVPTKPR